MYFDVRGGKVNKAQRLYRVYLFEDELFFIDYGTDVPTATQNIAVSQFGLLGGLIAGHLAEKQRKKNAERCWHLDIATCEELSEIVEGSSRHWRLAIEEIASAGLAALSGWERFWKSGKAAGMFRYVGVDGTKFRFEFLKPEGMKLALDHLPDMLADKVEVNAKLDYSKFCYIRAF